MKRLHFVAGLMMSMAAAQSLAAQTVSVDKTSLSFSAQFGGTAVSQTVNVSSTSGSVPFLVSNPTSSWLTVNPTSGNTPSALTVTANPAGLNPGNYSASFSVGTGASSVAVMVSLAVSSIAVNPQTLQLSYQTGGPIPSQNLSVFGQPVSFSASATTAAGGNWLEVNPASGTSPGTVSVTLNPAVAPGLAAGTYTGTITITPTSGSTTTAASVPVTLTVSPLPSVTLSSSSVALSYQIGGVYVPQQVIAVSVSGNQQVAFSSISSVNPNPAGRNWITISPANGGIAANGNVQITIGYDTTANLPAGTYQGTITLMTSGSPASFTIPVTLLVSSSPLLIVPSGGLSFSYQLGGSVPAPQNVTALSTAVAPASTTGQLPLAIGAATANNSGNWLGVPTAGLTGTPFAVSVNPTGLVPGTYTGTITVAATGAANNPQTIPVTLVVSNNPLISVSSNTLTFEYQINGANNLTTQNLQLTSSTGAVLNYTAVAAATTGGNAWLELNNTPNGTVSGTTDATLSVSINPAGLAAGTYNGTITITGANPLSGTPTANTPVTVAIVLFVSNSPLLVPSAASLAFSSPIGTAAPPQQTINLSSSSATDQLNYSVSFTTANGGNWLFVAPITGTTPSGLSVSVSTALLSAGTYNGTITVTATNPKGPAVANSPLVFPVSLRVTQGSITLDKTTLTFSQLAGGSAPAAQTVNVTSNGQPLTFAAVAAVREPVSWLSVSPTSGTTPGALAISVDGSKLSPGTYQGVVTVTSPNATNSPATITVNLTVAAPATISATPATLTFAYTIGQAAPQNQPVQLQSAGAASFSVSASTTDKGTWLGVTPTSGSTPATLAVSVNPSGLAAGNYTGTISITSPTALAATTVQVSLSVSPAPIPKPLIRSIQNGASYFTGNLAPGENVTIFGTGIGPATLTAGQAASGAVATTIANTQVMFGNVAAPIIYVSASQTSVMVPYEVYGQPTTSVTVIYNGVASDPVAYNIAPAQPGIYTLNEAGTGPGAILNQDGHTVNSASAPAPKGSVVSVYMTGEGLTSPPGVTGAITPVDGTGLKHPVLNATATVGGVPATIFYIGSAPGDANGITQANVQIPASAPSGAAVPLVISFGTSTTAATISTQPGVTLAVQ